MPLARLNVNGPAPDAAWGRFSQSIVDEDRARVKAFSEAILPLKPGRPPEKRDDRNVPRGRLKVIFPWVAAALAGAYSSDRVGTFHTETVSRAWGIWSHSWHFTSVGPVCVA
jgi:hypothetical protein